jgi:hypothetical protein
VRPLDGREFGTRVQESGLADRRTLPTVPPRRPHWGRLSTEAIAGWTVIETALGDSAHGLPLFTFEGASHDSYDDNFIVMGINRVSIDELSSGKFIGTTTAGERNGALVALEVHIFPENMRGTGEGHYDWDLRPTSMMTNGNDAKSPKFERL